MDGPDLRAEETPDHALFTAIARSGETCDTTAKAAMATLYTRYAGDVYKYCWRFHNRLGGKPGVLDHVEQVFYRVWRSAATFCSDDQIDAATQRRATIGWLQRIALNLYLDRTSDARRRTSGR